MTLKCSHHNSTGCIKNWWMQKDSYKLDEILKITSTINSSLS